MNRFVVVLLLFFGCQVFAQSDTLAIKIRAKIVSATDLLDEIISAVICLTSNSKIKPVFLNFECLILFIN